MKKILYIQFTNPEQYPPLEHGSKILVENGWECLFLARRGEMTGRIVFEKLEGRHVSVMPKWTSKLPAKLEFIIYFLWTLFHVVRFRPQVVYLSDPLSTPIGALFSKFGKTLIYHEHDSPPYPPPPLIKWSRLSVFRNSNATIIPNKNRLRLDEIKEIKNLLEVKNFPSRSDVVALDAEQSNAIRIAYIGTIVPSRLPIGFFELLTNSSCNYEIQIIGYETSEHQGYLSLILSHFNSSPNLKFDFRGAMPRREMLESASGCDVGLLLFSNPLDVNEGSMTGASNKICDYLAAGIPLICFSTPEFEKLANELRGIYNINKTTDVPALLIRIKERYSNVQLRIDLQKQITTTQNYESEFQPVLRAICSCQK